MPGRLEPEPLPRRDFLGIAGLCAAGLALGGSVAGMARLPNPTVLPEPASRFRAGRPEEFPVGSAVIIPERNVRLISEERGFAALSLICTHLGCIVAPDATGFACPCHGSRFGPQGEVTRGPAPRALRWLEVSQAADGSLVVSADREVEPGTFYKA